MHCPQCSNEETKVIDSRDFGRGIRRRRQCLKCGARFTTLEQMQSRNLFVVKKDGRREAFNRDKLISGIRRACEKRPLRTGAIDKLVDDIEADVYRLGKAEVPSAVIGDMVMHGLKGLDNIAYIRFASVYREFADIGDLKEAVDSLVENGTAVTPTSQLPLLPEDQVEGVAHTKKRRLVSARKRSQ